MTLTSERFVEVSISEQRGRELINMKNVTRWPGSRSAAAVRFRFLRKMSRKSATIFGQETIPEPSTPHIGKGVALVARTVAFAYI
jgi:hypothetical protein